MEKIPFYKQYNLMDCGPSNLRLFQIKSCWIILVFFLFSGSCSHQNQADNLPEHARDLENLTIYSASDEQIFEIDVEREQKFGDTTEVIIGRISDFAVDVDGRVYIADADQLDIKVYVPDGRFLTRLGRRGEGPGEFQNIVDLQTTENKLYAYDPNQQRIIVFSLDSLEYEYTVNIAGNRGDFNELRDAYPISFYMREDNSFLLKFTRSETAEDKKHWDQIENTGMYYFLGKDGQIISEKLFEAKSSTHIIVPVGERLSVGRPINFFSKSLITFSNEGEIYLAQSKDFLIEIYNLDGNYQRGFYYPSERVSLTKESAYATEIPEFILEGMSSMDLPESWPAIQEMLIDDENQLWVSTIVEDFDIHEWWILEDTGELITKFKWPRDESIEVIKNGFMYTRQTDEETSLQQVVRYRIEMD